MARLYDSHGSHGSLARTLSKLSESHGNARASGEAARGRGKVLSSSPSLARLLCSPKWESLLVIARRLRKPGDEVELFWLFKQNGGTVGRTLYSSYEEIV